MHAHTQQQKCTRTFSVTFFNTDLPGFTMGLCLSQVKNASNTCNPLNIMLSLADLQCS